MSSVIVALFGSLPVLNVQDPSLPARRSAAFYDILHLPTLTAALLHNQFEEAVLTLGDFQTSLCSPVLDRPRLRIKTERLIIIVIFHLLETGVASTILKSHSMWNLDVLHSYSPGSTPVPGSTRQRLLLYL